MNAAVTVLEQAKAAGVTLWADGVTLRYRGDAAEVETLLPLLKTHKVELLGALGAAQPVVDSQANDARRFAWRYVTEQGNAGTYIGPEQDEAAVSAYFFARFGILLAELKRVG